MKCNHCGEITERRGGDITLDIHNCEEGIYDAGIEEGIKTLAENVLKEYPEALRVIMKTAQRLNILIKKP